jgi:hypothetical protein
MVDICANLSIHLLSHLASQGGLHDVALADLWDVLVLRLTLLTAVYGECITSYHRPRPPRSQFRELCLSAVLRLLHIPITDGWYCIAEACIDKTVALCCRTDRLPFAADSPLYQNPLKLYFVIKDLSFTV